jgi:processive 1,2-diacylglycerol beta-glucosyltransferase
LTAPRVLITSAPYGAGHDRVAAALGLAVAGEGASVETVDHFTRFVSPAFTRASQAVFWAVLQHAPWLWGWAWAFSARLPTQSPGMLGANRLGAGALERYLQAVRPDVVVHVHPTAAGALSWLRARGRTRVPQAVVFTDFAAHPQWIYPHVDRYFVPAESVGADLVARGVTPERIVVSGIPIGPAFAVPADRAGRRRELGLAADVPVALVMGGLEGRLGGLAEVCATLARQPAPFQALVVCGNHAALARRLRSDLAADARFRILDRVTDVDRLMGAADFVVTKAGASTCAEALALERPLLFYRSLPGQERANEACLVGAGAALRASDGAELAARLAELLGDPARRGRLAAATARLRRPDAARTVAKELLGIAGGVR